MHAKIFVTPVLSLGLVIGAFAGDEPKPPRFRIETAERNHSDCVLIALADLGTLDIDDAGVRRRLSRFVEIRQEGRTLPALLTQNFVSLSNGDRLPLDPDASATLAGSRLRVWPAKTLPGVHATSLDLFASNVVLLFWSIPEGVDDPERFIRDRQEETRKRDIVYLRSGDRIEGTVTALTSKLGCVIVRDGRTVQTSWSKLAGIAWNTDRQARLRTKKAFHRAVLEGGARVNFLDLRFDEQPRRWVGRTQFGATLELPETSVLALEVRQGPAIELSDLTPARYEQRPFLGATWPLVKDAAATGQAIRLNGNTYEKGLGTHAPCKITYALDGRYQRFDALVGIDLSSRRGRARVAIELDGKRIELNDGKELTSQTTPLAVRLEVSKVREMTLIVDLGSFGDVQANVNWARTRLIKSEK